MWAGSIKPSPFLPARRSPFPAPDALAFFFLAFWHLASSSCSSLLAPCSSLLALRSLHLTPRAQSFSLFGESIASSA
ncbi:hypothetical protein EV126DRAFT_241151 [Verticillium dahliae]|nr:hypothetical protein EV126DRAFT_241151 [Verticillium dahliae]